MSVPLRMALLELRAAVRGSWYAFSTEEQQLSVEHSDLRHDFLFGVYLQHRAQPAQINTLALVQLSGHSAPPVQRCLKTKTRAVKTKSSGFIPLVTHVGHTPVEQQASDGG